MLVKRVKIKNGTSNATIEQYGSSITKLWIILVCLAFSILTSLTVYFMIDANTEEVKDYVKVTNKASDSTNLSQFSKIKKSLSAKPQSSEIMNELSRKINLTYTSSKSANGLIQKMSRDVDTIKYFTIK